MDYLKLLKDRESELQPMYDRMDNDANVFNLAPYEMKDPYLKRKSRKPIT
jgi:hypothetical protein